MVGKGRRSEAAPPVEPILAHGRGQPRELAATVDDESGGRREDEVGSFDSFDTAEVERGEKQEKLDC